jgi:hypothetical protein
LIITTFFGLEAFDGLEARNSGVDVGQDFFCVDAVLLRLLCKCRTVFWRATHFFNTTLFFDPLSEFPALGQIFLRELKDAGVGLRAVIFDTKNCAHNFELNAGIATHGEARIFERFV